MIYLFYKKNAPQSILWRDGLRSETKTGKACAFKIASFGRGGGRKAGKITRAGVCHKET